MQSTDIIVRFMKSRIQLRYLQLVYCVLQDLVAFSEKHEIQLLTHADPKGSCTCIIVNEQKVNVILVNKKHSENFKSHRVL